MLKQLKKNVSRLFKVRARMRQLKRYLSPASPAKGAVMVPSSRPVNKNAGQGKSVENPRIKARQEESRVQKKNAPKNDTRKTSKNQNRKQGAAQEKQPSFVSRRKTNIPPMPEILPVEEHPGKIRFTDLELAPELLAGTQDMGFQYCTEIQGKCLPYALAGNDLAAKAQTGTGKTAAFLVAAMTRLIRNPRPEQRAGTARVLVLAPTRELAIQIHKDAEVLGKYTSLNNLVIFGGMDHKGQRDALREPIDILVGTPGRIIDYSQSGHLDLSETEILVIDEADRMLDMGFIPDVRRIVAKLPGTGKRQTMLFSATLEPEILRLVDRWLSNPVSVESEPEQIVTDLIEQKFFAVLDNQKLAMLLYILNTENPERVIIFGNRKDKNRSLVRNLYMYGIDAELLSGDIPQQKRLKILENFRAGTCKVLVATDVAARGIHVDGISHVINYDLPDQPDDYVHRIGRTGRAGAKGISISFVCEYGAYVMPGIEEYIERKVSTIQPENEMLLLPEKTRKEPPKTAESNSGHGRPPRRNSGGSRQRSYPRKSSGPRK